MLHISKGKVLVPGSGGTGFGTATGTGMKQEMRAQVIPVVLCKCFGVDAVIVMK